MAVHKSDLRQPRPALPQERCQVAGAALVSRQNVEDRQAHGMAYHVEEIGHASLVSVVHPRPSRCTHYGAYHKPQAEIIKRVLLPPL
jgi:hypothetical protein